LAQLIVVFVQQAEKFEDAGRGQLRTFEIVEPDALAGKTDIQGDFAMQLTFEAVDLHRSPARRTKTAAIGRSRVMGRWRIGHDGVCFRGQPGQ
jgi:hypothetical protein